MQAFHCWPTDMGHCDSPRVTVVPSRCRPPHLARKALRALLGTSDCTLLQRGNIVNVFLLQISFKEISRLVLSLASRQMVRTQNAGYKLRQPVGLPRWARATMPAKTENCEETCERYMATSLK